MEITRAEPTAFVVPSLRTRAEISRRSGEFALFRVLDGETECGFIALDLDSEATEVGLEEIFIACEHRNRGVGCKVMAWIEEFSRRAGRTKITVWAHPLESDDEEDKEKLIAWYVRRGFVASYGRPDELEKLL